MMYNCELCNYNTDRKFDFNRHEQSRRHKQKVTETEIKRKKKSLECLACKKQYVYRKSLYDHIRKAHPPAKKRTVKEKQLNDSVKKPSQESERFECRYCESTFTKKYNLAKHVKKFHKLFMENSVREKKPFLLKCPNCDKTFKRKFNLDRHFKAWHSTEGKKKHSRKHPNINNINNKSDYIEQEIVGIQMSRPRRRAQLFECNHCKTTFKKLNGLTKHYRTCPILAFRQKLEFMQNEMEMKLMEQKIKYMHSLNKQLQENNQSLEKDKQTYEDIITVNGQITLNTLTLMNATCPDVPAITDLRNDDAKVEEILYYDINQKKLEDPDEEYHINQEYEDMIDTLCFYGPESIHKYIANNIIKEYGTDDAKQRSFWSTDIPRNSYIVMDYINGTDGEKIWKRDSDGVIIMKKKIIPIINKLSQDCFNMWKYLSRDHKKNEHKMDRVHGIEQLILNNRKIMNKDVVCSKLHYDVSREVARQVKFDRNLIQAIP